MNCKAASALSMPPVARIGKPGRARAMADTARRAMGLPYEPGYIANRTEWHCPTRHRTWCASPCQRRARRMTNPDCYRKLLFAKIMKNLRIRAQLQETKFQETKKGKTLSPIRPETVLVAVQPLAPPSRAATAMLTMSVTLGVSFAKNGLSPTTARTQLQR